MLKGGTVSYINPFSSSTGNDTIKIHICVYEYICIYEYIYSYMYIYARLVEADR